MPEKAPVSKEPNEFASKVTVRVAASVSPVALNFKIPPPNCTPLLVTPKLLSALMANVVPLMVMVPVKVPVVEVALLSPNKVSGPKPLTVSPPVPLMAILVAAVAPPMVAPAVFITKMFASAAPKASVPPEVSPTRFVAKATAVLPEALVNTSAPLVSVVVPIRV